MSDGCCPADSSHFDFDSSTPSQLAAKEQRKSARGGFSDNHKAAP
jgi:hypothetical protein